MENRSFVVRRPLFRTRTNLGTGVTTGPKIVTNNVDYVDSLYVSTDRKGDHVHPNNQEFTVSLLNGVRGRMSDRNLDIGSYVVDEGTLVAAGSYDIVIPLPTNSLWNAAVSNLSEQIRGSTDLSIDTFQYRQTSRMFKTIPKFLGFVKGFAREASMLKDYGSKWLAYRYGWQPLLQDIYGCIDQMIGHAADSQYGVTLRARSHQSDSAKGVSHGYSVEAQADFRCQICVTLTPKTSVLQTLQGYTALNPVSIAWELLPYSFVVDWFYDIGGYVRNLETAYVNASRFASGYVTYGYRQTCRTFQHSVTKQPLRTIIIDAEGESYRSYKLRTVLSSIPVPRAPVLNLDLGSGRLLNAAALLSQFLKR